MELVRSPQPNRRREIGYARAAVVASRQAAGQDIHEAMVRLDATNGRSYPPELSQNRILDALPIETRHLLGASLQFITLKKQQYLFHEDDTLDFIYFPVTAVISEFRMLEDGRMVEIALTGRDGAVGISSLLLGLHLAPHITQVSQAGTVHRVAAHTLAKMVSTDEKTRAGLSQFLGLYIRQISQKAICNMYHSVKERLCTWLLMAQDLCGSQTLDLTQEQIARILGVYRPSVTCIAQELRADKLIDYSRGGISITDRKQVKESACACYGVR